jgi:hypothetical protein
VVVRKVDSRPIKGQDGGAGAFRETGTTGPPMPARRPRGVPRVQLNTRVRHDIDQLLVRFVAEQSATMQDTVDLALQEFLAARGYHLETPASTPPAQTITWSASRQGPDERGS